MNTKLKIALLQAGRPAWKVAESAGLSPTILTRIVTGQRQASDIEQESLARELKTPVHELFDIAA